MVLFYHLFDYLLCYVIMLYLLDLHLIPYIKILILILCPTVLLIIFWVAYKFYIKIDFLVVLEYFVITATITFYYFQSPVVNGIAGLLDCTTIENSSYITDYLLEKCTDNPRYYYWRNALVIPGFFFLRSYYQLFLCIICM